VIVGRSQEAARPDIEHSQNVISLGVLAVIVSKVVRGSKRWNTWPRWTGFPFWGRWLSICGIWFGYRWGAGLGAGIQVSCGGWSSFISWGPFSASPAHRGGGEPLRVYELARTASRQHLPSALSLSTLPWSLLPIRHGAVAAGRSVPKLVPPQVRILIAVVFAAV